MAPAENSDAARERRWEALIGLFIAVVCMIAHLILHSMAKRHKMEMERSTTKLENLLAARKAGN